MGTANQTAREFLLVLVALRALLRNQYSLQAFVFSRHHLLKVQEVLPVIEFSKVCPRASENVRGRALLQVRLCKFFSSLGHVSFVGIFPMDSLPLFFLF